MIFHANFGEDVSFKVITLFGRKLFKRSKIFGGFKTFKVFTKVLKPDLKLKNLPSPYPNALLRSTWAPLSNPWLPLPHFPKVSNLEKEKRDKCKKAVLFNFFTYLYYKNDQLNPKIFLVWMDGKKDWKSNVQQTFLCDDSMICRFARIWL